MKACSGLGKKQSASNNISLNAWRDHVMNVFNSSDSGQHGCGDCSAEESLPNVDSLDRPISEEEVLLVIKNLKLGKSSGLDGILAEMFKSADNTVAGFLTDCFNELFKNGEYPDLWTQAIIVPIHKKADTDVPDSYRGVSMLSILGKCYTAILNKRLYDWLEENDKTDETQAGFRRGYSTTDHVFTLCAMTQKHLSRRGGKLYVAFIDIRKAFDL